MEHFTILAVPTGGTSEFHRSSFTVAAGAFGCAWKSTVVGWFLRDSGKDVAYVKYVKSPGATSAVTCEPLGATCSVNAAGQVEISDGSG